MKYDEILSSIGEFGICQKRILALLCFPALGIGSFCIILIVILFTPDHRCKIPSLPNDTFAIQSQQHAQLVNETIPPSSDPTKLYDKCHMYITAGNPSTPNMPHANTSVTKCNEWVYDQTVFTNTFTSQLNLVCSDSLKTSHIMMIFYLGLLVGDITISTLSDSKGRKKALCLAMFITLVTSVAATFAPEFFSYTVLMFVVGGSAHGAFLVLSVLSMEMVGPSKRIWAITITQITACSGHMYVAAAAFLSRSWTAINLSCAIPFVVYLAYWWLIPESPRWLISKKMIKQAVRIIRKTAKVNKTSLPENIENMVDLRGDKTPLPENIENMVDLRGDKTPLPENIENMVDLRGDKTPLPANMNDLRGDKTPLSENMVDLRGDKTPLPEDIENMYDLRGDKRQTSKGKLWHVFASPILLRRTLILGFNWMVVCMAYYGVTMNTGNMGGNFFLNFFLIGLVEIPGILLSMVILDRLGRRWSNAGAMVLGGMACLATLPTVLLGGDELQPLTLTFALIGKASVTSAFCSVYMFTAELLPTVVRNSTLGACSCAARIGSMIAPYIAKSGEMIGGKFGMVEPLVVFGALSILSGLLLLLLPETLNKKLPDTIAEGEQFGRISEETETEVPLT